MLKRSPIVQKGNSLKRGGTIKKKPKTAQEKADQQAQYEKDWLFFMEIWTERPHRCEISDVYLGEIPKSMFFDHLLPKRDSRYKHLRYEKRNIILVHGDIHAQKTNGFASDLYRKRIDQALQELIG